MLCVSNMHHPYDDEERFEREHAATLEKIDEIKADIAKIAVLLHEVAQKHEAYWDARHDGKPYTLEDCKEVILNGVFDSLLFDLNQELED